jgi:hypothetical protein
MSPDRKPQRKRSAVARKPTLRAVPSTDPGPPYNVLWHPDAVEERDASWPADEIAAIEHAVEKLRQLGPRLRHPHSSAVQGEAGKGLRELRPRAGRSRWRPIYRQMRPDTFVILAVGQEAQIDQASFRSAVLRAQQRFRELEID